MHDLLARWDILDKADRYGLKIYKIYLSITLARQGLQIGILTFNIGKNRKAKNETIMLEK